MHSIGSIHAGFKVVIAGAGVAGLEAALALREFGDEQLTLTLVSPDHDFVDRPMTVSEPFAAGPAGRYLLDEIARDIGAELVTDRLTWVDPESCVMHTEGGQALSYDALLLTLGARMHSRFRHALTIDDSGLDELLHGLIQDVEGGYVRRLAFIVPPRMGWPLPIYELALMTAERAYDMNIELSITVATPEDAPLAIFGPAVSAAVSRLLEENGILTITSAHCEVPERGRVTVHPGARSLHADRIVALPELYGPAVRGLPGTGDGFIPVNPRCRVPGVERVYAAGDATDFPIKHGGVAAQQADVAAQAIAALAGLADAPRPFRPVIRGVLLTGNKPLYLSAQITGQHGSHSEITEASTSSRPPKIAAAHLAPYLASREHSSSR